VVDDVVQQCVAVLDKGDALIQELKASISTNTQIITRQAQIATELQKQLDTAQVWYRQPSVVAPVSALLTLLILLPIINTK
jgi:hypothetical protein